jgi:hypothetical protein
MEPASLSISLVGVIDPLIRLSGVVKAYRSFTPDSDALNAQFEAERLRFERWNRSVGADRGHLSADDQTRSVVEDLLSVMDNILETKESIHQIGSTKERPSEQGHLRHGQSTPHPRGRRRVKEMQAHLGPGEDARSHRPSHTSCKGGATGPRSCTSRVGLRLRLG